MLDRNFIFYYILIKKNRKKKIKISFQYLKNDPTECFKPHYELNLRIEI